ncbi:unnamed protein product [Phytomonas sp. EM1]|nr:unnamed protein product [Phytomonas sp. EM1]|eukprot:CCW62378.1 unnamed protein product [Phytomonas sp. isolate EM1]
MSGSIPDASTEDVSNKGTTVVKSILSHELTSQPSSCLAAIPKVTFINVDVDDPTFSTVSGIASVQSKSDTIVLTPPPPLTLVNSSSSASASNTNDTSSLKRPLTLLERRSRERNGMNMSSISGLSVETIQDSLCESYNTTIHEPVVPIMRGWSRKVKTFLNEEYYQHVWRVLSKQYMKSFRTKQTSEAPLFVGNSRDCNPTPFQLLQNLKGAFTIVAYNILAGRYVTTDRYPHCPLAALGESYRIGLVQKEIQQVAPDIIIFAEMTVDAFENSLGAFLRVSMHYEGDYLVITDRQGVPRCDMGLMSAAYEDSLQGRKDTAGDLPEDPVHDTMDSRVSYASPYSPALSGSPCATDYAYRNELTHHESDEPEKNILALVEVVSRRTEMEGVAIFYNRNRFKLLEKVPIQFNKVAAQDPDVTDSELKKLQMNTHNVALVCVLQDLTMPAQIYIVAAVHLLYQHIKFQLWQSHHLLNVMESLKFKYENYKEGVQRKMPLCSSGIGLQPLSGDQGTPRYMSPPFFDSSLADTSSNERHITCLIAGDLNVDKSSPVFKYLLKSTVPASTPVLQSWSPCEGVGRDTPRNHTEEGLCCFSRTPETPLACCVTRADLPCTFGSSDHTIAAASFGGASPDQGQRTSASLKTNTKSITSSVSQKSPLTTSSDAVMEKSALTCIDAECCDSDIGSVDNTLPHNRTSGLPQNVEDPLLRPKIDVQRVVQASSKRKIREKASPSLFCSPYSPFRRRSLPGTTDPSTKDSFWSLGANITDSSETLELIKKQKAMKPRTTSRIVVESGREYNEGNKYTSPLHFSKHFNAESARNISSSSLKEERDTDVSSLAHGPIRLHGLEVTYNEATQKGSNMTSVVMAFNPLPFKKLGATMFEHQTSPSWANLTDHRDELDSPLKPYHAFDQSISCFSHSPQQWDPEALLLDFDSPMCAPDKKPVPTAPRVIFPKFQHQIRFSDTYEVYCIYYPLSVSAVNPSTNMEGKVLDHILVEEGQLACLGVLHLGDNRHLPTRNIPSDHYIVGALLAPTASLISAIEEESQLFDE